MRSMIKIKAIVLFCGVLLTVPLQGTENYDFSPLCGIGRITAGMVLLVWGTFDFHKIVEPFLSGQNNLPAHFFSSLITGSLKIGYGASFIGSGILDISEEGDVPFLL